MSEGAESAGSGFATGLRFRYTAEARDAVTTRGRRPRPRGVRRAVRRCARVEWPIQNGPPLAMTLQVSGALLTDIGRQRSVNEDWCGSFAPDHQQPREDVDDRLPSVWVIADGVSRFGTGRDAARCAVEAILAS